MPVQDKVSINMVMIKSSLELQTYTEKSPVLNEQTRGWLVSDSVKLTIRTFYSMNAWPFGSTWDSVVAYAWSMIFVICTIQFWGNFPRSVLSHVTVSVSFESFFYFFHSLFTKLWFRLTWSETVLAGQELHQHSPCWDSYLLCD